MIRTVVPLSLLAAVLVGCGGDDEGKASPDDRTSSAPSPTASATPDPAELAIAESAVLTLDDFPAGWQAKDADEQSEDDLRSRRRVAECVGVDYDDLYITTAEARVDSQDFVSEDDDELSNTVSVTTDEERAASSFAILAGEKYRACALDEVRTNMKELAEEEDVEVGEASLNEISFDDYGDETTAFRVTLPIRAEGTSVEFYLDFVAVRVGRAATTVSVQSSYTAFDSAELSEYVRITTDRLERALG